jgi:hypothetical protein
VCTPRKPGLGISHGPSACESSSHGQLLLPVLNLNGASEFLLPATTSVWMFSLNVCFWALHGDCFMDIASPLPLEMRSRKERSLLLMVLLRACAQHILGLRKGRFICQHALWVGGGSMMWGREGNPGRRSPTFFSVIRLRYQSVMPALFQLVFCPWLETVVFVLLGPARPRPSMALHASFHSPMPCRVDRASEAICLEGRNSPGRFAGSFTIAEQTAR